MRYAGEWYEMGHLPNAFQPDDGHGTTATYGVRVNGGDSSYHASFRWLSIVFVLCVCLTPFFFFPLFVFLFTPNRVFLVPVSRNGMIASVVWGSVMAFVSLCLLIFLCVVYGTYPKKGTILRVINQTRKGSFQGSVRRVEGIAWVPDVLRPAQLKVSFFFFPSDYHVLELDSDYQYALVGEPTHTFLWILSRVPVLDPSVTDELLQKATDAHGYSPEVVAKMVWTPQSPTARPFSVPTSAWGLVEGQG